MLLPCPGYCIVKSAAMNTEGTCVSFNSAHISAMAFYHVLVIISEIIMGSLALLWIIQIILFPFSSTVIEILDL